MPKRDLLIGLQVCSSNGGCGWLRGRGLARDLVNELSAMRTWVSGFVRERFEPDRARKRDV